MDLIHNHRVYFWIRGLLDWLLDSRCCFLPSPTFIPNFRVNDAPDDPFGGWPWPSWPIWLSFARKLLIIFIQQGLILPCRTPLRFQGFRSNVPTFFAARGNILGVQIDRTSCNMFRPGLEVWCMLASWPKAEQRFHQKQVITCSMEQEHKKWVPKILSVLQISAEMGPTVGFHVEWWGSCVGILALCKTVDWGVHR